MLINKILLLSGFIYAKQHVTAPIKELSMARGGVRFRKFGAKTRKKKLTSKCFVNFF